MTASGRRYDVLVSGTAAFSAAGAGAQALLASAIAGIQPFDRRPLAHTRTTRSAPEVYAAHCPPPPVAELLGPKGIRTLSYEARMFASAGVAAMREAGWSAGEADMVVCGTVNAGLDDHSTILEVTEQEGADRVNPAWAVQVGFLVSGARLSMSVGATGPCLTVASGRCAGMEALSIGADALQDHEAAGVLAGGVDVLSHAAVSAYNGQSEAPPRPFDRDRTGAVPGEAAAVVAMCRADRGSGGQPPRAHLVAYASAVDLVAGTDTLAGTIRSAIDCALEHAGWAPRDVGLVVSSACGDVLLDRCEAQAIATVLGPDVPVWTVNGHTGLTAGADGPLQVLAAAAALRQRCVPPVVGLAKLDPSLPPFAVLRQAPVPPLTPRALCLTVDLTGRADVALLRIE